MSKQRESHVGSPRNKKEVGRLSLRQGRVTQGGPFEAQNACRDDYVNKPQGCAEMDRVVSRLRRNLH